ncbi:hotdog fold thioesterase, partial [Escherichia coli]|nr:hotdog fold thioesterase [Escherichia coli]
SSDFVVQDAAAGRHRAPFPQTPGDDVLEAEMPVDTRTHQPFGLLHGGASAALAETLGSMAGFMMTRDGQCVVGTELNATHHRPVSEGKVRGVCQPLHLGRQNQS